jgi:hypothetical protein
MDQVSIKYANIFQCKTLQNLPKFGYLVENKQSGNPGLYAALLLWPVHMYALFLGYFLNQCTACPASLVGVVTDNRGFGSHRLFSFKNGSKTIQNLYI